jgi:hypothetical protein
VTSPEGIVSEQVITLTQVVTVPNPLDPWQILQYRQIYSGGLTIISDTTSITPVLGYTETHTIKIVAHDAAGNKTESEITRFHVIHDPEAVEEEQPEAILVPVPSNPLTWRAREGPIVRLSSAHSPASKKQMASSGTSPPG